MGTEQLTRRAARIGAGAFSIVKSMLATIDPGSLATVTEQTLGPFTVAGAKLGDVVEVAAPYDLAGTMVCPYVSAANAVSIRHRNGTAGTVDLVSGAWRIVIKRYK